MDWSAAIEGAADRRRPVAPDERNPVLKAQPNGVVARHRQGLVLGSDVLCAADLAAGRLVAPFALSVPKGMRWYLVYRGFQSERRDFVAFFATPRFLPRSRVRKTTIRSASPSL